MRQRGRGLPRTERAEAAGGQERRQRNEPATAAGGGDGHDPLTVV